MARRRLPKDRNLRRRGASRSPRYKIVVVCEGEKTEPHYFTGLQHDLRNSLVDIAVVPGAGDPRSVVERAVAERNKLQRGARRTRDSFDSYFAVWAVFDRDEHPRYAQAVDMAKGNEVNLATSNPCFELWLFLHFCDHHAPTHRHEMQRMLEAYCDEYCRSRGKEIDYDQIKAAREDATARAEAGLRRREEEGSPFGNPSTTVFRLVRAMASGRNEN